jgi:hypothetical protein
MTASARLRGDWALGCLVVVASGCAATDAGVGGDAGAADSGCGWSRCATAGPRCVATGIADRSWLTADFD